MNKRTLGIGVGVVVVILVLVIAISSKRDNSSGSLVSSVSFLDEAGQALKEGDIIKAKDLYK